MTESRNRRERMARRVGVGGVVCSTVTNQYGIRFNGSQDCAAVVVLETFHTRCVKVDVWFAHVLLCAGILVLCRAFWVLTWIDQDVGGQPDGKQARRDNSGNVNNRRGGGGRVCAGGRCGWGVIAIAKTDLGDGRTPFVYSFLEIVFG